jgi:amino acid adenylation domain-containing protein
MAQMRKTRHQKLMEKTENYCPPLPLHLNEQKAGYPKDSSIHQLFEAQVERADCPGATVTPASVAVVFEDEHLTYSELNQRANKLAHYLQSLGVGPEVMVCMYMDRSLEMLVGILGILKAGGAYVPLDPAYPQSRVAFVLEDTKAPVLLTQQRLVSELPEHGAHVVCLDTDWGEIAQESESNPVSGAGPENLAYVIYTSGSTGKPKGVLIKHSNVVRLFTATESWYHFDERDVWTLFHSYAFDFSVWEIWGALLHGGRLVVVPYLVSRSPEEFYDLLCKEQVTILNQTPSAFSQLIRADECLDRAEDLALRLVIFGGEALNLQSLKPWFERHPDQYPKLVNMYGITETTVHVTYRPITTKDVSMANGSFVGVPIPDLQVYILDEQRQPVPIGVVGEMYVDGAGLARGYLNRPELTSERFIPNPFSNKPGACLYKSGDLARYLPNGDIDYLGRIDHQVKIRGFRIELGEIEAAISKHPAVREAVVIAREDVPGDKHLVAYIVPSQEQAPTISQLHRFLQEKLPDYMVPSAFVMLETLPLTINGKVDRRALPVPQQKRPPLERAFAASRDPLEFQLTKIWEQILSIQPIGIKDNFFELGGNSLRAVRLFTQIEEMFSKKLPLATLFQAPTIEQLACVLREEGWTAPWRALVAVQAKGDKPPFFCVHAVGGNVLSYYKLANYLGENQPFYGLQARGLDGKQTPHTRIEDMAADYIKEIQTLQPEGPYFLGGHSFAGLVAYEMATQLYAQGQKVALLALFDSATPNLAITDVPPFKYQASIHWLNLSRLKPKDKLIYVLERVKWSSERLLKQKTNKFNRWCGRPLSSELNPFEFIEKLNRQALINYQPQVYPGQVTLMRAIERETRRYYEPLLGWGKLAAGGVEVIEVPGHHGTMIAEPHVRVLAEKLRDCLDKAAVQTHLVNKTASISTSKVSMLIAN